MNKIKPVFNAILVVIYALAIGSCSLFQKTPALDPESEEFLSRVRYIITSQERKTLH